MGIGRHRFFRIALQVERQFAIMDALFFLAHDLGQEGQQREGALAQRHQACFGLRQVEHVLHLLGQLPDRQRNRLRIFGRLRRQLARDAAGKQLCEPADRGQRSAEFVTHIGEETGHHRIGLLERAVAFAQRDLGLLRRGDVEHGQHPIAIGQRHAGEVERPAIGELDAAIALLAIERGGTDHLVELRNRSGVRKIARDRLQQVFGLRVPVEHFGIDPPGARETAVPQFEVAVGREHGKRLEQIVECRGPRAQQRIARCRQRELFGAVFGNHHQPPIGKGLRDDTQMGAVGQRPGFFVGLVALEPLGQFVAPGGEVAHFGDPAVFARDQQHLPERCAFVDHAGGEREYAVEGLVGKGHAVAGIELRHADRKLVEHRTLRFAEGTELARLLLHFLDIDRIAGDPLAHQREVGDTDRAPRAFDRRAEDAFDRLAAVGRLLRDLGRSAAIDRFDQFDLVGNDLVRAFGTHRGDIGLVDQPQLHVGPAEPHRHRGGLDQSDQRAEILASARRFLAQLSQFRLAVAEVEDPDER